jgi:magnesium-transporting ATPase (P-type)
MDIQPTIEERLWEYIDGTCNEEEKTFIGQLIATNMEWRAKYHELLDVHQLMGNLELDQPSMRFTQNVMEDIGKHHIAPAAQSYINKKVIWGIFTFFMLTIVGFLIYGFGQVDWSSGNGDSRFAIDLSKVDMSVFFNNTYTNAFMMVNVILGLVLLDMYLSKKKKQLRDKQYQ